MYYFKIFYDRERSEHAGAGGMFQVTSVEDHGGNERDDLIDPSQHYHSVDDVRDDIAKKLGLKADQVDIEAEEI